MAHNHNTKNTEMDNIFEIANKNHEKNKGCQGKKKYIKRNIEQDHREKKNI